MKKGINYWAFPPLPTPDGTVDAMSLSTAVRRFMNSSTGMFVESSSSATSPMATRCKPKRMPSTELTGTAVWTCAPESQRIRCQTGQLGVRILLPGSRPGPAAFLDQPQPAQVLEEADRAAHPALVREVRGEARVADAGLAVGQLRLLGHLASHVPVHHVDGKPVTRGVFLGERGDEALDTGVDDAPPTVSLGPLHGHGAQQDVVVAQLDPAIRLAGVGPQQEPGPGSEHAVRRSKQPAPVIGG